MSPVSSDVCVTWSSVSGPGYWGKFRRCGLVGVSTSLGEGFEVSFLVYITTVLSPLCVCHSRCELLRQLPCLPPAASVSPSWILTL